MSRLGLRQIRKPNVKGATFVVDPPSIPASVGLIERVTNGVQTGNKETTNGVQTGNKQVTAPDLGPTVLPVQNEKRVTQRVTSNRVNGVQTGNKQVTNHGWETLRGHEARLLQLIFDECRTTGDLLSPPITLDRIAAHLETRKGTAKTIIFRLTQKEFIKREASATGRGGFTRFRIERDLYQALLIRETEYKRVTNGVQTGNKEVTQRVTQRVTSAPSSSSVLDLENSKTTTTGDRELSADHPTQLSPRWAEVDLTPLADMGFSRAHLVQLASHGKLTPDEVQDSIHHFAFDLNQNGKGQNLKGPPISFFMGILRKGVPYAPPENFESPVEAARRLYVESKRRLEERRQAEERELMELEFAEWRRGLDTVAVSEIVPEWARRRGPAQDAALRTHFENEIWPAQRAAIPGAISTECAAIAEQIEQSLGEAMG